MHNKTRAICYLLKIIKISNIFINYKYNFINNLRFSICSIVVFFCLTGIMYGESSTFRNIKFKATPPHSDRGEYYIWMEAEEANVIRVSFEIAVDKKASKGKYLAHNEGTGSAWMKWKGTDGNDIFGGVGEANYIFEAPVDGEYLLWARVKWESGCSAAFTVNIDDIESKNKKGYRQKGAQETLGKSSTIDSWHWYSRHIYFLKKGIHTLSIKNQDDGSHIDKMLLTNNLNFIPNGTTEWQTNFDSNNDKLLNWLVNKNSWDLRKNKKTKRLELIKNGTLTSPISLKNIKTTNSYYLSFYLKNANKEWKITNRRLDKKITSTIHKIGDEIKFNSTQEKNKIKKLRKNLSTGVAHIELFNYSKKIYILINGKVIYKIKKENTLSFTGTFTFNLSAGNAISNIELMPIENIHFGGNYYCHFGNHQFKEITGEWTTEKDRIFSNDSTTLAIIGKPWWRNYQITGMIKPPVNGNCGFIFQYKNKKHYYYLAISSKKVSIFRTKKGKTRLITNVNKKLDSAKKHRITINSINGILQVYINGIRIIQKKAQDIFSGMAGIKKHNAADCYFDDIEITTIKTRDKSKKNEYIPFFKNHKYVQSRTVLDNGSFGIGECHPGEDNFLKTLEEQTSGKKSNSHFKNIGFHWQTLDHNAFRAYNGEAKGPGFVIAQSFTNEKKRMWSIHNQYGNWELTFKLRGELQNTGVILQEIGEKISNSKFYTFEYITNTGMLKNSNDLIIEEKSAWKKANWNIISVKKQGKTLSYSVNGIKIGQYENISTNILLRPAITYRNGTLFIDNIFINKNPDLFYHFEYNQSFDLALSDWSVKYDKKTHWGGYHSYLILTKDNNKPVTIKSKRKWSGNFMFSGILNPGTLNQPFMKKIFISFENPKSSRDNITIKLTPKTITLFKNGKGIQKNKLDFLNSKRALMGNFPGIDVLIRNQIIKVFLSDKNGAQHLVIQGTFDFSPKKPFLLKITGSPALAVHSISIWGKEIK